MILGLQRSSGNAAVAAALQRQHERVVQREGVDPGLQPEEQAADGKAETQTVAPGPTAQDQLQAPGAETQPAADPAPGGFLAAVESAAAPTTGGDVVGGSSGQPNAAADAAADAAGAGWETMPAGKSDVHVTAWGQPFAPTPGGTMVAGPGGGFVKVDETGRPMRPDPTGYPAADAQMTGAWIQANALWASQQARGGAS